MTFPSWIEFIKHYNAGLLTGPILLMVAIWIAYRKILFGKLAEESKSAKVPLSGILMVFCLLIGLGHFIGVYASVLNAFHFRSLQIEQVTKIEVVQMIEEDKPASTLPVIIEDRAFIAEGLNKLRNSNNRDREHDTLVDGYRIQLITASKKQYYISVYQKSSNSARGGVIPHIGLDSGASMDNAGEYTSPEFQDWVLINITPLFNKRT